MQAAATYPVQLLVDLESGQRNRLTVFLRVILAIPVLVVLSAISGGSAWTGAGVLFVATLLMLVVRHRYPRWWFEWNRNVIGFANRVLAYLLLLRDEYPSTEDEQHVHVVLPDPQGGASLNRWMPLVKWLLAVPHIVALFFLGIAAAFATLGSWVVILVTGRSPRRLNEFVVGVMRWALRVQAYAFALVTDEYPPFSLRA